MVGCDELINNFKRLVANNVLSHAYLFFGREGEEKFALAHSLANFLENSVFEEPTQLLQEVLIVAPDAKGTIGIDSVRNLKNFLWQKPVRSTRRVAIIKEAENLTSEAQNAALKIVEEPPESALIIFIAEIEDNLLPVLVSRTQKIYFPKSAKSKTEKTKPKITTSQIDVIIDENQIDQFFQNLINDLMKNPVKNFQELKETLNRFSLIKQFNTNKRLQLRALFSKINPSS